MQMRKVEALMPRVLSTAQVGLMRKSHLLRTEVVDDPGTSPQVQTKPSEGGSLYFQSQNWARKRMKQSKKKGIKTVGLPLSLVRKSLSQMQ